MNPFLFSLLALATLGLAVARADEKPKPSSHATDGLSFEQAAKEFLIHAPAPPKHTRALATVAALEQLLTAVHVSRAERRA